MDFPCVPSNSGIFKPVSVDRAVLYGPGKITLYSLKFKGSEQSKARDGSCRNPLR